jgi:uncharacterized protein (TIGR02246 family)
MTSDPTQIAAGYLARFRAAWDSGNASAYADLFTERATYVIFLGQALRGRNAIRVNHVDVFARWQRGTRMAVEVMEAQEIAEDAISVLARGGIGSTEPIPLDKLQTFTLVRRGEIWLCAAFQNTAVRDA